MKFEMNLKIEKPRYFTVSDITYAQVDAWFGHTTRDLKLDLIYPKLKNKKSPSTHSLFSLPFTKGFLKAS